MDNLIKNIKSKLSVDNLVEMMKEAKVIDEKTIKEEDVRRTLEKVDTNNLVDVDELAQKLNEITEQTKRENAETSLPLNNLFTKPTPTPSPEKINEEKDSHFIKDDVSFLD